MAPFRIVVGFVVLLRQFTSACDDLKTIATCSNICIDVSGGVHSWEWQYTAKATEPQSGKSASSDGHYDSGAGAGQDAIYHLMPVSNTVLGVRSISDYDAL